jgi:hypothetical protein
MKFWRVADVREEELFTVARSYLPTAFPNPNRDECPPEIYLRALASRPGTADPSIEEHISFCSPCVARYLELLSEERSSASAAPKVWIFRATLALAAILLIAVYVFVVKPRTHPIVAARTTPPITVLGKTRQTETAVYVPVVIDLSNASPTRGSEQSTAGSAPQIIPSESLVDLSLRLPLGSDERLYSIALRSPDNIVWSESARAHRQNGDTLLRVHADFSNLPAGNYDLQVASAGRRLTVPVLVKDTMHKNTEPKP